RECLPGFGKIVDIGGNLALFQSPVADDDARRCSFDLFAKVDAGVHQLGVYLPVFLQQNTGQLHRGPALVVHQYFFDLADRLLTEQADGSDVTVAGDAIVAVDMIFVEGGDDRNGHEAHIDLIPDQHFGDLRGVIDHQFDPAADGRSFDAIE